MFVQMVKDGAEWAKYDGGELSWSNDAAVAALQRAYRRLKEKFSGRDDVEIVENWNHDRRIVFGFTVRYKKHNWFFEVGTDMGVLEVTAKPETLERWRMLEKIVQSDLFNTMRDVGLIPPRRIASGGHINIGVKEAFGRDTRLLRNFFVDFTNHSELATGAFLSDAFNAPALNAHPEKRKEFARLLKKLDPRIKSIAIKQWIDEVKKRVYSEDFESGYFSVKSGWRKFQALALHDERVEVRAVRAQQSANEFTQYLTFFESWIEALRTEKRLIPYTPVAPSHSTLAKIRSYHDLIKRLGLDWNEYKLLLPKTWQIYEITGKGWFLSPGGCLRLLTR